MIHLTLSTKERSNLRYTSARLEKLRVLISAVRLKLESIALAIKEPVLKKSLLMFVAETNPCEEEIKHEILSILNLFPVNDLHKPAKNENDELQFIDPFTCSEHYEKKIIKAFRDMMNDYEVQPTIRKKLQHQLNEFLYAFQKLRLLHVFEGTQQLNNYF